MVSAPNAVTLRYPPPPFRPLRAYAFDPTSAVTLDRAIANEVTLKVPWEDGLRPGPVGAYVEVIDFDPESECFYAPVDLNDPALLAQSGLPPAQGVPQFHQQMTYALVMATVLTFERGLGRAILWSPRTIEEEPGPREEFVERLRVFPHALRARQAFYSPLRKALLLGYFPAETAPGTGPMRATSFTCLSHGVVAHETAHAILDGLRRAVSFDDAGGDELAVQEALADLVGLLQQFALPDFVRHHVGFTATADENQRLLEELARGLAQTAGVPGELRRQIGGPEPQREQAYPRSLKFQDRASLLVAAVFDAFVALWRGRCATLSGSGVQPGIALSWLRGDPLAELSAETSRCASQVLRMCIRAIDYCPPVDVTVGDFLQAVITADTDVSPEDDRRYRVAFVEAFRRRGLCSFDRPALSPLQLLWRPAVSVAVPSQVLELGLGSPASREQEFEHETVRRERLRSSWLRGTGNSVTSADAREMGLVLDRGAPRTIERTSDGLPRVSVDSCRLARRTGPNGRLVADWVITITQRRRGYFDPAMQEAQDGGEGELPADFIFRGGCTLLVDATTGRSRFCIAKDILARDRLARHRESAQQHRSVLGARGGDRQHAAEPFAVLRGGPAVSQ